MRCARSPASWRPASRRTRALCRERRPVSRRAYLRRHGQCALRRRGAGARSVHSSRDPACSRHAGGQRFPHSSRAGRAGCANRRCPGRHTDAGAGRTARALELALLDRQRYQCHEAASRGAPAHHGLQRARYARSWLYQRLFRRLAGPAFRSGVARSDQRRTPARAAAARLIDRERTGWRARRAGSAGWGACARRRRIAHLRAADGAPGRRHHQDSFIER